MLPLCGEIKLCKSLMQTLQLAIEENSNAMSAEPKYSGLLVVGYMYSVGYVTKCLFKSCFH